LFGSWVPCGVVHSSKGFPSDRWPMSSLAESGGVVPGTGYPTPVIWLLVELVMSRLLGHNRWSTVPRVQDPDRNLPLMKWYQISGCLWGIIMCFLVSFCLCTKLHWKSQKELHSCLVHVLLWAEIFIFELLCLVHVHCGWVLLLVWTHVLGL
jgi:hypothetical protein